MMELELHFSVSFARRIFLVLSRRKIICPVFAGRTHSPIHSSGSPIRRSDSRLRANLTALKSNYHMHTELFTYETSRLPGCRCQLNGFCFSCVQGMVASGLATAKPASQNSAPTQGDDRFEPLTAAGMTFDPPNVNVPVSLPFEVAVSCGGFEIASKQKSGTV
jgi:hypothetical protein